MSAGAFEEDVPAADRPGDPGVLRVDLGGFEGPLDVLLDLARSQKVDLLHLSILTLAEQYLGFIEEARRLRLELAADYLVMAAWLAFLKSRLLLPPAERAEDEPDPELLARRLAARLVHLDLVRASGARLLARPRLGRDVFARGAPEGVRMVVRPRYAVSLHDLLAAYVGIRTKAETLPFTVRPRATFRMEEVLERMSRIVGAVLDWTRLDQFLPGRADEPGMRASAVAATFTAALELAKQGRIELRQDRLYGPIYLRRPPEG